MTRLRLATANIAHGRGRRGRVDLRRTAQLLARLDADVLCLQEVDRHWSARSAWADQAAELATALAMTVVYGAAVRAAPLAPGDPPREYGNAVLSRSPILAHRVVGLPVPPRAEPRCLLLAQIEGGLTVGCVHLQHNSAAARTRQAAAVAEEVAGADPLVLAGDFNAEPGQPELAALTARLTDGWTAAGSGGGRTFPARLPMRRLDQILVSSGVRVSRSAVVRTDASDHRPVVVDVDVDAG